MVKTPGLAMLVIAAEVDRAATPTGLKLAPQPGRQRIGRRAGDVAARSVRAR